MTDIIKTRFEWRRGTAAQWTTANPVLLDGEPGRETDTGKWKIGDGVTRYNDLPYQAGDEAALSAMIAAEATGGLQPKRRPAPALYGAKRLLIPVTGHGWTLRTDDAAAGSTTIEDTTRPGPFSDRSIELTRGASGYAQALSPALTGLDLSAGPLTIWIYCPNANPKGIQIAALDEAWANGYQWERYGVTDVVDGWAAYELYITDPDVAVLGTGGATVATRLRVRTSWDNDQAWLGAIIQKPSPVDVYPNGVATLYFDDGAESVHNLAYPILSKYGAQAVIATICDQIGIAGLMTIDELRELQDRGGWEIALHAYTLAAHNARYDTLTADELEAEFRNGKKWLLDNGFDSDAWISPGGVNNSDIFQTARRFFSTVRSVAGLGASGVRQGGAWTAPRPMFPANIPSLSFDTSTATVANMNAVLDKVKASKSWGHLTFHSVTTGASSGNIVSTTDLDAILAHAETIGVPIRTVRGVLQDANGV